MVALFVEADVGGLEVTVDEAAAVRVLHRSDHVREEEARYGGWEATLGLGAYVVVQLWAVDAFHDNVRGVDDVDNIHHTDDVRMMELLEHVDLPHDLGLGGTEGPFCALSAVDHLHGEADRGAALLLLAIRMRRAQHDRCAARTNGGAQVDLLGAAAPVTSSLGDARHINEGVRRRRRADHTSSKTTASNHTSA
eukprot:7377490-Prymnesium_polylepis.2